MKFDDQLAAYLHENKSLTLEGIGIFTLDDKTKAQNEQEKEVYGSTESVTFTYNQKSNTDEKAVFFLVKQLGKIEPLIKSDLEYYLSNIKQLLNIGQPYTIKGIGTLNKNDQGAYELAPEDFFPAKETLNQKRENVNKNHPARSDFSVRKVFVIILIIIAALAAIGGIGWGISNFIGNRPAISENNQQHKPIDTITQETGTIVQEKVIQMQNVNTPNMPKDTSTASTSPAATAAINLKPADSVSYKMVFEVTKSKERAHMQTEQFNGIHSHTQYDSIPINDSVAYYRLFLTMKIVSADTTRIKDSLQKFFGKRIFMEKQAEP